MEIEEPPKAGRLLLVSLGVVMILGLGSLAAVFVFRLQPQLPVTCSGKGCTPVVPGTVVTMPAGVSKNEQLNFSPDKLTVVIGINNTVTFQNLDSVNHTVTSVSVPSGASTFNSKNIVPGGIWNYTFTTPGNYTYHCIYHFWMTGAVVVKQNALGNLLSKVIIPAGTSKSESLNFKPNDFILIVGVNNTVEFVNQDSVNHTVTFLSVPSGVTAINSGNIMPGQAWIHTFKTPGTYTYHCIYHFWMTGTITVISPTS